MMPVHRDGYYTTVQPSGMQLVNLMTFRNPVNVKIIRENPGFPLQGRRHCKLSKQIRTARCCSKCDTGSLYRNNNVEDFILNYRQFTKARKRFIDN